jgi:hypothetical protein
MPRSSAANSSGVPSLTHSLPPATNQVDSPAIDAPTPLEVSNGQWTIHADLLFSQELVERLNEIPQVVDSRLVFPEPFPNVPNEVRLERLRGALQNAGGNSLQISLDEFRRQFSENRRFGYLFYIQWPSNVPGSNDDFSGGYTVDSQLVDTFLRPENSHLVSDVECYDLLANISADHRFHILECFYDLMASTWRQDDSIQLGWPHATRACKFNMKTWEQKTNRLQYV